MAETPTSIVSEYLHRIAANEPSDADLLARFVATKDGEPFAVIVKRYGPMVLGVCRRGAGDAADDAFQATFLALARQAARVSGNLPGWLHRVATRIAQRSSTNRSRPLPSEPADTSDDFARVEWRDVRAVLDVELDALPRRLRTPLVLCYLDGLARDEAAARIGCSLRTLHRRLDEGRRRLRSRLTQRGIAPVALAATVLASDGLRASVPPPLTRLVIHQITGTSVIPASVHQLLPGTIGNSRFLMKTIGAITILAGGLAMVTAMRSTDSAQAIPPTESIRVSIPAQPNAPDTLAKKVEKSKTAAIAWLIKQQQPNGSWGNDALESVQPGGATALVLLALLENGLTANDATINKGLSYLRGVKPKHTYVVSLQTQVLCLAKQKQDADLIKANVAWLESAVNRRGDGRVTGWTYGKGGGTGSDNSNTRYAISGLYAASKAGFKLERMDLWKELREMVLRMQSADGGWGYTEASPKSSQSMTCSALLNLAQIEEVIGQNEERVISSAKKGRTWLGEKFTVGDSYFPFYHLDVLSQMAVMTRQKKIGDADKARDWYRDGCNWLLKNQQPEGQFQSKPPMQEPNMIGTAFALRFLRTRND